VRSSRKSARKEDEGKREEERVERDREVNMVGSNVMEECRQEEVGGVRKGYRVRQ